MDNITTAADFRNMSPGVRRDTLKSLGLNNLYFVERYNKRFRPYTITAAAISQALNNQNPLLLQIISEELEMSQHIKQRKKSKKVA